jgi:hypothetical protein
MQLFLKARLRRVGMREDTARPEAGRKNRTMTTAILNAPGLLFLGSDIATARAHGARPFKSAANAIRFAMEQAAPVSLRGARLTIGGQSFGPKQIRRLYADLTA